MWRFTPAGAPAASAGRKERGQDGATDGTEEVGPAGLARLIGGEDLVGCDELVASGLQSGGEAGPVWVGVDLLPALGVWRRPRWRQGQALRVAMPRSLAVGLVVKDWRCRGVSGAGRCRRGCG